MCLVISQTRNGTGRRISAGGPAERELGLMSKRADRKPVPASDAFAPAATTAMLDLVDVPPAPPPDYLPSHDIRDLTGIDIVARHRRHARLGHRDQGRGRCRHDRRIARAQSHHPRGRRRRHSQNVDRL